MNARERLNIMVRTDRGSMTVWSPDEVRAALDAYRTEVLAEAADYVEERRLVRADIVTDFDRGRRAAEGCIVEELREMAGEEVTPATATPEFFQPGHTYTREHHGNTVRFLVRHVDTSPDGIHRIASGWRIEDGDVYWSPSDSDDMDGWTDVTEAGDAR